MVHFQDIIKDPEWDNSERIWEPPPEQRIPGVTFSGYGLHAPVAGALSSFMVTFENYPELPNFKVFLVQLDDDGREILESSVELNYEVIPGYGFRVIFVLHEDANYKIKIIINDLEVSKRLMFYRSTVYHDHVRETWEYLFQRIQKLTEHYQKVIPPALKIINETQETVAIINNAANAYQTALEATQNASQSSAGVGLKLLDILNSFDLPTPAAAAADEAGANEPDFPGGGPDGGDGRPPRNGLGDGRPQPRQRHHPPPARPQHPPPPPPTKNKRSTPSMFFNSVFFDGGTTSLPQLEDIDRESPPIDCYSEPAFVGFMCNFPVTTTKNQNSDGTDTKNRHKLDTPRSPGLKRKRDHFTFDIQVKDTISDIVEVVEQVSQALNDVSEALDDDPEVLDEGDPAAMEEVNKEAMEEANKEAMEEAYDLYNDSYNIISSAAASPINNSSAADDDGRPSKRHCSHSISDVLGPPPLDDHHSSSSGESSWSELMANLEVARIFMPQSSSSSSSSYVSVRRSFTPPRSSTPKPNQRRAGRMTLREQKRVDYKGFF